MDFSLFPTDAKTVFTIGGAAVLTLLAIEWIKHLLPDWRLTNLAAFLVSLILVEIAAGAFIQEWTLWERLYKGFLVAFVGASLPTFGRESLLNLAGLAGLGPRADAPPK
jgi:hypothetical protein